MIFLRSQMGLVQGPYSVPLNITKDAAITTQFNQQYQGYHWGIYADQDEAMKVLDLIAEFQSDIENCDQTFRFPPKGFSKVAKVG